MTICHECKVISLRDAACKQSSASVVVRFAPKSVLVPKLGESAEPVVAMFATRFAMRGAPLGKVGIV